MTVLIRLGDVLIMEINYSSNLEQKGNPSTGHQPANFSDTTGRCGR